MFLTMFPTTWQFGFQKPATIMMEGLIDLHHDIMSFLVFIICFVGIFFFSILKKNITIFDFANLNGAKLISHFAVKEGITHHTILETIWTIIPTLILLFIATPSFALIYALDEIVEPELTIRAIGRQWYWTYEIPETLKITPRNAMSLDTGKLDSYLNGENQVILPESVKARTKMFNVGALQVDNFESISSEVLKIKNKLTPNVITDKFFIQLLHLVNGKQVPNPSSMLKYAFPAFPGTNEYFVDYSKFYVETKILKSLLNLLTAPANPSFSLPSFAFNSYLIPTEDLIPGTFRLLEVNRKLVLPVHTNIRLLITSYDVLHSWAIPAFGVKVDAVPGRLNEYFLNVLYLGTFYGQCSEICGVNHGFMPIKIEIVSLAKFNLWFSFNSLLENSIKKFVIAKQL